jgi:hypothetical protein
MCTPVSSLRSKIPSAFTKQLLCNHDGVHCIGPAWIKREMSDCLDQFFLFHAVFNRFAEMKTQP